MNQWLDRKVFSTTNPAQPTRPAARFRDRGKSAATTRAPAAVVKSIKNAVWAEPREHAANQKRPFGRVNRNEPAPLEALAASQKLSRTVHEWRPAFALAFSCAFRREILGTATDREMEILRRNLAPGLPIAGFYSFGEIAPPGSGRPQSVPRGHVDHAPGGPRARPGIPLGIPPRPSVPTTRPPARPAPKRRRSPIPGRRTFIYDANCSAPKRTAGAWRSTRISMRACIAR